jgi:hypothetical protein
VLNFYPVIWLVLLLPDHKTSVVRKYALQAMNILSLISGYQIWKGRENLVHIENLKDGTLGRTSLGSRT